jgi:O-antigen/teichoic acid export membrane protein
VTTQSGPPNQGASTAAAPSLRGSIQRVAGASALALMVGEFVSFVQTIALARLLTPAEIGTFVAGTVLTTFLGNFVEGGLRGGLVQRKGDIADAAETVFWVTLTGGVLMSLAALGAAPILVMIFDSRTAGLVAAATSGVVLLHSLTNVPESILQREFNVRRRLIVGPLVSISYAVVSVALAFAGWGVWAMVAGTYASYLAWVAALWMITDWRPGRARASIELWRELARYGMPLVLGMLGSRTRTAMEAFVVGRGLSPTSLGHFRYGQRISRIPMAAIIEVGSVSLFPAFSRIVSDRDRMQAAYVRALHWATVGAAATTGLMIVAGEPAVVVLFGERWRGAGIAVVAMSGISLGYAMTCVSEEAIKASGRTRLLNWYTAIEVTLAVTLLVLLVPPFGLVGAALSLSVTSLLVGLFVLALAQLVVPIPVRRLAAALTTPLPGLAIATTITWLLEHRFLHSDIRPAPLAVACLCLDVLIFLTTYLAVLTVFARQTVLTLLHASQRLLPFPRPGQRPSPTTIDVRVSE